MVYSNKFVVSVLVNGQVMKEMANGEVHVPFNSEYTLRFRNKNDRNCAVRVWIDGEEMTKGGWIIPPRSYRDVERSSHSPAKFKFVDLQSTEAQDHGKDQSNSEKKMGLIECHFYLEKERPKVEHHYHPVPMPYPVPVPRRPIRPYPWYDYSYPVYGALNPKGLTGHCGGASVSCNAPDGSTMDFCSESVPAAPPPTESVGGAASLEQLKLNVLAQNPQILGVVNPREVRDGATVEGSHSNQQFGQMYLDLEDHATVLKLYLRGHEGPAPQVVEAAPVTQQAVMEDALFCDRCGTKAAKKSSQFCHKCGNKLK